jgi:hypothetical protein
MSKRHPTAEDVELQLRKRCVERKIREALDAYAVFSRWRRSQGRNAQNAAASSRETSSR